MTLRDRLTEDMKQAMKAKEAGKLKLSVIRMVRSAAKYLEIDRHKELDDNELLEVVAKEVKMRKDSLDEFRKANRPELLATLEQEIAILMEYLPEQMGETEVRALVAQAVADAQASGPKDMGKVMALLMPKVKGRADGKLVNSLVKEMLS
ncbi:MAG TPA: GatB/YqeY domain-containing protein [Negativicutes bacterium]|nr:GatB/YqeY domain-containing protein [Negativicutes bacterium]